ncbi:hypothetical protein [Dactylosporangium sp. CA-233914]|uniref:hypothetical protein n=1 Tax=Dactylosporangium sp. CA-233914 TaxID=3239934 RepID=UPI003D905EDB
MKRVDLVRKIGKAAVERGLGFVEVREGGSHTIYRCGTQNVVVPGTVRSVS